MLQNVPVSLRFFCGDIPRFAQKIGGNIEADKMTCSDEGISTIVAAASNDCDPFP